MELSWLRWKAEKFWRHTFASKSESDEISSSICNHNPSLIRKSAPEQPRSWLDRVSRSVDREPNSCQKLRDGKLQLAGGTFDSQLFLQRQHKIENQPVIFISFCHQHYRDKYGKFENDFVTFFLQKAAASLWQVGTSPCQTLHVTSLLANVPTSLTSCSKSAPQYLFYILSCPVLGPQVMWTSWFKAWLSSLAIKI